MNLRGVLISFVFTMLLTSPAAARSITGTQKEQLRFAQPVAYNAGGEDAISVAVADLNGDGKLDLVAADMWQGGGSVAGEVAVLMGNGDGTFQPAVVYSTGAYDAEAVAVGDVNGDGVPDLVVVNDCGSVDQYDNCTSGTALSVLLGNGDGTFQPAAVYSTELAATYSLAMADLRGIGILDLVVPSECLNPDCQTGAVSVFLGNGDGTFQPGVSYSTAGRYSDSVAIGDLNGNGVPDLIVAEHDTSGGTEGAAAVLMGNGDGTFQPAVLYDSGGPYADWVAVADLRNNGTLDAVLANGYGDTIVGVLLGNGDGTFQSPISYNLGGVLMEEVAIRDVNGDGIPDLAVVDECKKTKDGACFGDGQVKVLLGNGDGTFQAPILYGSGGYGGWAIAIGDVNGDGRADLIVTNFWESPYVQEGTVAVLLNETSYTTTTTLTSSPNPSQVNQSVTFTATISSSPAVPNGEVVTFYNGKTELGTGTTTNGIATLATSFSSAGKFTIKAAYPGDGFRKPSSGSVKQVVNK